MLTRDDPFVLTRFVGQKTPKKHQATAISIHCGH
jgi:hypothetical protein